MRLLDSYAGEGAAGSGYGRAGWRVVGVEWVQSRARRCPYPCHVGDALPYITRTAPLFDAVHASPPCQFYTRGNAPRRGQESRWPRSIPQVREVLEATGLPYVIENVVDAGWDMRHPVKLCGCQFGLTATDTDGTELHLRRPRLFEANWPLSAPRPCAHRAGVQIAGVYGGARRDKHEARHVRKGGYVPPDKAVAKALLGVAHDMTWAGLFEAIPPAYTEHIGRQLAGVL